MTQSKLLNDAQLRLLLPKEWVAELDTIASVRCSTRLALIRQYLRRQIDHDLINIDGNIKRRNEIKRSKIQVDSWLQSKQQENDEW